MLPILSIIIVNFHSEKYLLSCLRSLAKPLLKIPHEIIIINNDQKEKCLELEKFAKTKIVQMPNNSGFGVAANTGAKKAAGKILFFLNPDTVFQNGNFQSVFDFFSNNYNVGIIGLGLKNPCGKKEPYNYGKKISPFQIIINNVLPIKKTLSIKQTTVDWVSGGALLIKKSIFDKIGGFDENFFMYYEDVDLCLRAKKAGFFAFFWSEISFIHASGKSFKNKKEQKRIYYQSQKYYWLKYYGKIIAFLMHILQKIFN